MKDSHLKNSLIAAGIAVFAGVITLGANVAFGVTNPSQKPVDATLVSPTFGGLDVRGWLTNGTGDPVTAGSEGFQSWGTITALNNLNVNGAVSNSLPNEPVDINDDQGLRISGPITALAALFVEPSFGLQSRDLTKGIVVIKDNLFIAGHNAGIGGYGVHVDGNKSSITTDSGTLIIGSILNTQGAIKNTTLNNGGDVVIEDNLKVTGDAKVRSLEVTLNGIDVPTGAVTAEQFIANGGVEGAFMKTTGAITAGGLILSPDKNMGIESSGVGGVKINDPLDTWETIINTNKNNVGVDMPVKVDDNLTVSGTLDATGATNLNNYLKVNGSNPTILSGTLDVTGATNLNNYLKVNGNYPTTLGGTLNVSGKATATGGFGTTSHTTWGSGVSIAGGGTGASSVSCGGSKILLSCGYTGGPGLYVSRMDFDDSNTCYLTAGNLSGGIIWFNAKAICLDPSN